MRSCDIRGARNAFLCCAIGTVSRQRKVTMKVIPRRKKWVLPLDSFKFTHCNHNYNTFSISCLILSQSKIAWHNHQSLTHQHFLYQSNISFFILKLYYLSSFYDSCFDFQLFEKKFLSNFKYSIKSVFFFKIFLFLFYLKRTQLMQFNKNT